MHRFALDKHTCHGMPANLDLARLASDVDVPRRDDVWLCSEPDVSLALVKLVFSPLFPTVPVVESLHGQP